MIWATIMISSSVRNNFLQQQLMADFRHPMDYSYFLRQQPDSPSYLSNTTTAFPSSSPFSYAMDSPPFIPSPGAPTSPTPSTATTSLPDDEPTSTTPVPTRSTQTSTGTQTSQPDDLVLLKGKKYPLVLYKNGRYVFKKENASGRYYRCQKRSVGIKCSATLQLTADCSAVRWMSGQHCHPLLTDAEALNIKRKDTVVREASEGTKPFRIRAREAGLEPTEALRQRFKRHQKRT